MLSGWCNICGRRLGSYTEGMPLICSECKNKDYNGITRKEKELKPID